MAGPLPPHCLHQIMLISYLQSVAAEQLVNSLPIVRDSSPISDPLDHLHHRAVLQHRISALSARITGVGYGYFRAVQLVDRKRTDKYHQQPA